MMEQYSRLGVRGEESLSRLVRLLAEHASDQALDDVLAEAAHVVGADRVALGSESAPPERGAREVRVAIHETNDQLVATFAEDPTPVALERLQAVASVLSLVLRLGARERESERARFHVTLGRAVAGVVHDIANPLNALQLSLDAASDGVDVAEALEDSLGATRLIRSALDRLRQFSGVFDARPSLVDVSDALASALRISSFATRGLAEVIVRVSPGLTIRARAGELEHVFVNVLINAAQAMAGFGGFHHRITVRATRRNESVVIEVEDTGVGIAAGDLERVFDEGFTTKAARNGSGLGLSLCRDIVSKLGGTIEVVSSEGKGTCVSVTLPAVSDADKPAPSVRRSQQATENVAVSRVLVVEGDDLVTRALVRGMNRNAAVTTTASMGNALELIGSERFDLILCEHRPPQIDGLAVRQEQAKRWPERANGVVLMIVDETTELPAGTRVISKPVNIKVLKDLIGG